MQFTHDIQMTLHGMAALANSVDRATGEDALDTTAALDDFVLQWRWSGPRDRDEAELAAIQELRPRLRKFWEMGEEGVAAAVNALLAEAQAVPQLVNHDDWGWHLHATPNDAPFATRVAVEAAMAMADVVRAGELSRFQVCAAPDCDNVLVDLSRNRSRRFCSATCGNRIAAAAYRERQASEASD